MKNLDGKTKNESERAEEKRIIFAYI